MSNMYMFYKTLCANPDELGAYLRMLKALTNISIESLATMGDGMGWQLW